MKYYDTYLPYIIDDDYDWSYPAPEMQLLWRLDDLQDRLEELIAKDAPYRDGYIYSEDDIRYGMHSPMRKNGNLKTRLTCGKPLKAARVHEYICLSSEMKRATTCMCRQMNTAARNTVLDYIMH